MIWLRSVLESGKKGSTTVWMRVSLSFWIVLLAALHWKLSSDLRNDTFFTGDPGVKWVVAREALEHPTTPLHVSLEVIGEHSAGEYLDPFYVLHEDHAHALTSPLFPFVSAPMIAAFGMAGAYVLPTLCLFGIALALVFLHTRLGAQSSPAVLLLILFGCSPLVFYSFEFWEHTPAVFFAGLALISASSALQFGRRVPLLGYGFFVGIATLLRPEMVFWGVAVAVALFRGSRKTSRRFFLLPPVGFLVAFAPWMIYGYLHFGSVFGPHLEANAAVVPNQWLAQRLHFVRLWLVPWPAPTFTLGALLLVVVAIFSRAQGLTRSPARFRVAGLLGVLLVATGAASGALPRESLWLSFPVGLLVLLRSPSKDASVKSENFLGTVIIVYTGLVLLTAPNDGGGQWGPRYLLPVCFPLTLMVAERASALARAKHLRRWVVTLIACIIIMNLVIQRRSYRDLRWAKEHSGRVVDDLTKRAPNDGFIMTDLWWLDQIAASTYGRLRFLYVADQTQAIAAVRRLESAQVESFVIARSALEVVEGETEDWIATTSYRLEPTGITGGERLIELYLVSR